MAPGLRLLLPLVLCVGLGAFVSSSGAGGFRKRGPSVTAKRRAATSPMAGGGLGALWTLGLGVRAGEEEASRAQGDGRRPRGWRRSRGDPGGSGLRPAGPRRRLLGLLVLGRGSEVSSLRVGEASGTGGPVLQEGDCSSISFGVAWARERSKRNAGRVGDRTRAGEALGAQGLQQPVPLSWGGEEPSSARAAGFRAGVKAPSSNERLSAAPFGEPSSSPGKGRCAFNFGRWVAPAVGCSLGPANAAPVHLGRAPRRGTRAGGGLPDSASSGLPRT
ncbi:hypothetical protein P7K49_005130 [Saguinus oedipus]|uniref:Uncharacterized protein n=1 Tax=Saguinus oedipus TaxID=9490 RepID=A0ABQ9W9D8_SAGOE|nr:hypothetical protein P7K49_005130 [Saguinus oedipus]